MLALWVPHRDTVILDYNRFEVKPPTTWHALRKSCKTCNPLNTNLGNMRSPVWTGVNTVYIRQYMYPPAKKKKEKLGLKAGHFEDKYQF